MSGIPAAEARLAAELRRRIDEVPRPCHDRPKVFFPVRGGCGREHKRVSQREIDAAKAACLPCRVRPECLRLALVTREHGVRGGLTEEERHPMRQVRSTRSDVDGLAEAWSRQDALASSTRKALRTGLRRYLLWCREDDANPLQITADMTAFARWLTDMGVPPRSRHTAALAAQRWMEFLTATTGEQASPVVAS